MSNTDDLNYVNDLLDRSQPKGYPAIYAMWGIIVLAGFIVIELKPEWSMAYWVISNALGIPASIYIASRGEAKSGQRDSELGKRYATHFGVMAACIFIAMFSSDYNAILLITGLGYCLAGLYLERFMWLVGGITIACYIGVVTGIITSTIILGIAIALGLFAAAWAMSRETPTVGA